MIKEFIEKLEKKFKVERLNKIGPHEEVGDIDFLVRNEDFEDLKKYLQEQSFVVRETKGRGLLSSKFINGQYFLLDFAYSCDSLLNLYPGITFKDNFFDAVWEDNNLEKFFRYVLLLRSKQKYTDFVSENFDKYRQYLSGTTYLSEPIFKSEINKEDLVRAMQKNNFSLLKVYRFPVLVKLLFTVIKLRLQKINSGKIVAFVGADGAGKTTNIEHISYACSLSNPVERQYMGDYNFVFMHLYKWLHSKHIFIARLCYPMYLIENWLRYIKIRYWKLCGYTVFTDRWPGLNRHLRNSNFILKLNDLMYRFYPQPDLIIFISAKPEIIYQRRDELMVAEIAELQKNMRERIFKMTNAFEFRNENLDDCLNNILKTVYEVQ